MLAELDVELTLTTNASLLPRKAQALKDAGLDRITVSLDAIDDATFRAMNDVDFPVDRVLEGIEAARAVGLPVKVNCVVKRGVNEQPDRPDGALLPRDRRHAALHRVHGRRRDERLAHGRRRPGRRDRRHGRRASSRSSRPTPHYRGEVAKRWRYLDGKGEIGDHRLGHPAVLRRLHALADLGRGQALHLPLRGARPRPARADPQRRHRRGARAQARRDLARPRRPLLGAPLRGDRPRRRRPRVEMSYIGG